MAYGAQAATGYTDYYKKNSQTPSTYGDQNATDDSTNNNDGNTDTSTNLVEARKAALRKRLKLKKVSM